MADAAAPGFSQTGNPNPASYAQAVDASTAVTFTHPTRAIYVCADGNLIVEMAGDGGDVTFTAAKAGSIIPIRAKAVKATNAVAIVALW